MLKVLTYHTIVVDCFRKMVLPCGISSLKTFHFIFSSRCCVRARRFRDQTGRACGALEGLRDCPDQKAITVALLLGRQVRREDKVSQAVMEVRAIPNCFLFFFKLYDLKEMARERFKLWILTCPVLRLSCHVTLRSDLLLREAQKWLTVTQVRHQK